MATHPNQLKMTVVHWRNPKYTQEEFINEFYNKIVGPFAEMMKRHGITEFASYIIPKSDIDAIKEIFPEPEGGDYEFADYDMVLEYILPNLDVLKETMKDPVFHEVVAKGKEYVIPGKRRVSCGRYSPLLTRDGQLVNLPK